MAFTSVLHDTKARRTARSALIRRPLLAGERVCETEVVKFFPDFSYLFPPQPPQRPCALRWAPLRVRLGRFFSVFFFDVVFYAQKNGPWRQKSQKMCPTAPKWLPKWSQKWSPNLLFLLLADPCFRATVQRFSKILGVPRVSGAFQNTSKNRSRNRGAKKHIKNDKITILVAKGAKKYSKMTPKCYE